MATAHKLREVCQGLDAFLEELWRMPVHDLPEDLLDKIQVHASRLRLVSQALVSESRETESSDAFDRPNVVVAQLAGALLDQLKAKDDQIASLQRNSEDLITAIRHWQARALPLPGKGVSWWRRLRPHGAV